MRMTRTVAIIGVGAAIFLLAGPSEAYERYKNVARDDGSNCSQCHGDFPSGTSPQGSTFPGNSKHTMHRGAQDMNTECNLCHTSGDENNPFIGSSDGTANNPGLGCMGCHGRLEDAGGDAGGFAASPGYGAGLRQHHANNSVGICAICHSDTSSASFTPVGEHFRPTYYGTADTNADWACNTTAASATNENWTEESPAAYVGLDNDGDNLYDGADPDCGPPAKTAGDFLFDGMADILWRNTSTGQNWLHQMNGATIDDSASINTVSGAHWQIVGKGDYDGNGTADILWRSTTTGQNWMYLMAGRRIFSSQPVNTVSNLNWEIVGSGDYDGNGKDDILWRNKATGQNWMYLMNGALIDSSGFVNKVGNLDWKVVASPDLDGDGKSDILLRNSSTGQNWRFRMNGMSVDASDSINTVSNPQTHVAGIGDFDGDGDDDILWHNDTSGRIWMYQMTDSTLDIATDVVVVANTDWEIAGTNDYDGDGDADILLRNGVTGQVWLYSMLGPVIDASEVVTTVRDTSWEIVLTQ